MKNQGSHFEREIAKGFDGYEHGGIACLSMMPVPTAIGHKNGKTFAVRTKKAPFDVYGFTIGDGLFIGAELKSTSKHKASMHLCVPGQDAAGIEFHQLDCLQKVACAGGIARVVWDNGGAFGVIGNDVIVDAWVTLLHAIKSEASGKDAQLGSKSISWDLFEEVDYTNLHGVVGIDWLRL